MKSVKLIVLIASLLFVAVSCNKEGVTHLKKLEKITIQMECVIDGETVSYPEVNHMVFIWDGKLLSRIDYYDEGEFDGTVDYSNNEQNRVTTIDPNNIIQSQTTHDSSHSSSIYTYTYKNHLPETCTETVRNGEDVIKYVYHYYYK